MQTFQAERAASRRAIRFRGAPRYFPKWKEQEMSRTLWIAAGALVIVVLGWFAIVDTDRGIVSPGVETTEVEPTGDVTIANDVGLADEPVADDGTESEMAGEVVEENVSNRVASDVATDEAFESALEGEAPVQESLETSRSVASTTGAVGAADFTAEGFDREAVLQAIETSELEEVDKEHLIDLLAEAEENTTELEAALASVRAALETER